jgi:uncharacterized membrane protein
MDDRGVTGTVLHEYLIVKLVHIVSATLLFGTGLGTAFFMWRAYRRDELQVFAATSQDVVLADACFTLPAVITQLATGIWLTDYLGIPLHSLWFKTTISMFGGVGICWLPVVWIQIRLGRDPAYRARLMRIWLALGIPAFVLTLGLFAMMVLKPGL